MNKILLVLSIVILPVFFIAGQNITEQNSMSFEFKGAATLGIIDYEIIKPGYIGEFSTSYYLPLGVDKIEFGLKAMFRMGRLTGRSRTLQPTSFKTNLIEFYGGFTIGSYKEKSTSSYGLNLLAGVISFDPKYFNNTHLPNNANSVYYRSIMALQADLFVTFPFSRSTAMILNTGVTYAPFTDYLDDKKSGSSDMYITAGGGLRVNLHRNLDHDNDGISDMLDQCPGTPPGLSVDKFGCDKSQYDSDRDGISDAFDLCAGTPISEKADANGCSPSQKDSDLDGVNDRDDNCPGTRSNASVDQFGCADYQKDSDGDGVMDSQDKCPDTPLSSTVDKNGCTAQQLDADSDGMPNLVDTCPEEAEDYNFYKDEDGCPDNIDVPYTSTPIDFQFPIQPFNEDGTLTPHIAGALRLYIVEEYLNKFPNTSWILRVNSPVGALTKAENLKAFIDSEINTSERTRIEYNQTGNSDVIKMILDKEKAKRIILKLINK